MNKVIALRQSEMQLANHQDIVIECIRKSHSFVASNFGGSNERN